MTVFLPDHTLIRISFSCPGLINEATMPCWATIKRAQISNELPRDTRHLVSYVVRGGVLPSGLLECIVINNSFRLQGVAVREKSDLKHGQYSVLNFEFTKNTPQDESLEQEVLDVLRYILLLNWNKVKMYETRTRENEKNLSISFTSQTAVPVDTKYSKADQWGIQHLCAKK